MSSQQRYIAHFDLDSFFASVEVLNNPSLQGKPVLVGGSSERGVVAACNYEARKYGIHSAMPMKKAIQLCPHAVITNISRSDYSKYSRIVTEIIASKAPLFEKASIDEFYLDLTGMEKYIDVYQWTIDLRIQIINETKLPISFALASNKMVAKIATDQAKPNGYIQVAAGFEKEFLAPLSVNKIPGVGEQMFKTLQELGIKTIGDILQFSADTLERYLGNFGPILWKKAQGIHTGEVLPYHEAKSISTENTFEENKTDMEFIHSELVRMTERIAFDLRKDEKLAGCIAVKIRYPDFTTVQKQTAIQYTFRDDEMIPIVKDLFKKLYKPGMPIRLLGVRLSELTNHPVQGSLFDDASRKNELYKAIDDVKNKFGTLALKKARTISPGDKKNKTS